MEAGNRKKKDLTGDDIEKEMLKPITTAKSEEDKELEEWEVESTGGGRGGRGRRLAIFSVERLRGDQV
jgi:hypothetical protein